MNSRVKTLFGLVVLGLFNLLFSPTLTRADELSWALMRTEKITPEVFSSGQGDVISSYPPLLQKLITHVLSWNPKKELNNSTQLAEVLKSSSFNKASQAESKLSLSELFRNLSVEFDVSNIEHFRKVWFQLSPQIKVRGLFGIHDFKNRRPLVILRMGIHGNVDELFAERFIAKAVYEDLDANFLILENLTSHAFISENPEISFGGMEEGLHTFLILNYLSDPKYELSQFTSSYHLIGVSLGGQGTFVTALLDYFNQRKIKSILNMCPLINLKSTFDYHAQKGFKNVMVDLWNYHRMNAIYKNYSKQLANLNLWKMFFDKTPRFTPRVLKILNVERTTPLVGAQILKDQLPKMIWPSGFYDLITQSKSFYEMNDFWKIYQGVQTPMMIYTTPNDFLVINKLNSELIFQGQQPGDFRNLKFQRLDRGMHCGLASEYLWSDVVKMIKTGLQL